LGGVLASYGLNERQTNVNERQDPLTFVTVFGATNVKWLDERHRYLRIWHQNT